MNCSINRSSSPHRSPACVREGAIAAGLTALMILLFLGSWRSTLIVLVSIPLSILTSIVVLYFMGETLNTMTLGGLALAVGILVDDSTVTIENTHRLLAEEGMPLPQRDPARIRRHRRADPGLDARDQLRVHLGRLPRRVRRSSCSRRSGFAVVFAMLASYALSRTLTPVIIGLLLQGRAAMSRATLRRGNVFARFHQGVRARLRADAHRLRPPAADPSSITVSSSR